MRQPNPPVGRPAAHISEDDRDMKNIQNEYLLGGSPVTPGKPPYVSSDMLQVIDLIEDFSSEIESMLDVASPNPHLNMALHLVKNHLEGRISTASSVIAASAVPYATARRKLAELQEAGLIETRPRTKTGKSFSLHPSALLMQNWGQLADRLLRMAKKHVGEGGSSRSEAEYYFGGSYQIGRSIQPPKVLPEPLSLSGGLRILVHGDPTFMVMESLKRQFEQVVGTKISQRAFSIDRLHEEALRNGERSASRYDIIAVDLPWIGEFVSKGLLTPLTDVLDVESLDPGDFHTAGWQAAHWAGQPYGVPSQTTPELMFYRKDWFAEAGLEPPRTTGAVLEAAKTFHEPRKGRYGIAWNAARGTALGHTFMMTCADFGQPILNLAEIAGGFDAGRLNRDDLVPSIDTPRALEAAEYLMALLEFSPPDILSMSWYERVRPYAAGKIAMAYGYTLLAPYFELDEKSPANGNTGYLPHPAGPSGNPIAPVGGYVLCIPSNLPDERKREAAKALVAFTSPEAQKLYVQHGSRTAPRYSVGADPDVRQLSPIFEAVDAMSWHDELQFWPRPPVPQINQLIAICGEELHDMLRGVSTPRETLARVQSRAEQVMRQHRD